MKRALLDESGLVLLTTFSQEFEHAKSLLRKEHQVAQTLGARQVLQLVDLLGF